MGGKRWQLLFNRKKLNIACQNALRHLE